MAYQKINEKTFNIIKGLIRSGMPSAAICDNMEISSKTLQKVNTAESFYEYGRMTSKPENLFTADTPPIQKVVHEIQSNMKIDASHYLTEELRKIQELLREINGKLSVVTGENHRQSMEQMVFLNRKTGDLVQLWEGPERKDRRS